MTWEAAIARARRQLRPGAVLACLGLPGAGKTRAAQALASGEERASVFDPFARVDLGGTHAKHGWPEWGRVVSVADLLDRPALLDGPRVRLVVAPSSLEPEGMAREFAAWAELLWLTGSFVGVAEETELYGRQAVRAMLRILAGGRHRSLALVLVSQSLTRLPLDCRRHLSALVVGAQRTPADLDELRQLAGRDFAARVAALEVGAAPLVWPEGE